ncbi:unnamed protein product [Penicillium salamii]|uniref:6-phosphogluconolactonase n=1 Tax=Penicillium salamii TaxID=1612424 RepID=A0A9W4NQ76_9EURO|nr:unnamed protein product [Penicillium salamii]CAG8373513.1 unnamed protein product [Penicillium salamii]CAG8391610.1 unnamed protein product [Penicillium salamii]CAG8407161.1 unnamed protein product [Penicillium salamii]
MSNSQSHLYTFPGKAELAESLQQYVLKAEAAALAHHDTFRVAVSGGSLPVILAEALLGKATIPQFGKWDIFFADERAVPLDHADSNYFLLKEEFLNKIPAELGTPSVHPIAEKHANQDDDPQQLADLYQDELKRAFTGGENEALPIFDLILLGCGPDGHTCSLFPGHSLLQEKTAWVAAISDSPKPPPKRITLTLPVVAAATQIAFVATGGGKKEIMRDIFDSEDGCGLPSSLVNKAAGDKVSWFTDSPATEGIAYPRG